jgi:hypothetical protein
MKRPVASGISFIVLGVVFIAIGSSGQRAFLGIGAAFLVIGFVSLARQRRRVDPGDPRP